MNIQTGVTMLHKRQLMRDYRTHELVIGPRWLYDDIVVQSVTGPVHDRTSGLCGIVDLLFRRQFKIFSFDIQRSHRNNNETAARCPILDRILRQWCVGHENHRFLVRKSGNGIGCFFQLSCFWDVFFFMFCIYHLFFAGHLNNVKMSILCDRLVENYRKAALDYSGVDKSSQAAADMAGSGAFVII
jgi:hypothetical protein